VSGATDLTFPLVPRRRLVGLAFGAVHSIRRGTGSDIASSRPYQPGDDVDAIDWAASARLSSARGSDEFVVRERYADEAPRVVIVADRRPAMSLYPRGMPWLSKPDALVAAGTLIVDSAAKARGLIGYLDYASAASAAGGEADAEVPFWRPPHAQADFWRVKESQLRYDRFGAPEDTLEQALAHLAPMRSALPAGTFVFILSDFLSPPSDDAWAWIVELPWEIVPVIIQDPVWEQSFPDVASVVVPVANPVSGRLELVRLNRRECQARRRANEERLANTIAFLEGIGLDPVVVSSSDDEEIYTRFLEWVAMRQEGGRDSW